MSLKDVLHPLENLKQFYSFYFLVQDLNGDNSFVSESLNDIFDTNYTATSVGVLLAKFSQLFDMETSQLNALFCRLKKIATYKRKKMDVTKQN
jgi:hypothetical protein